jgi:2-hydroxycyclohexanecarboxyl-CoA dehydrogenase
VPLTDKIAVVTGGASGIGRAIALRLARSGLHVALWDLDAAGAGRVAAEIVGLGRRSLALEVDVASFGAAEAAAARVRGELGPVSVLVNDAGFGEIVPVAEMTERQWDRMVDVHLKGCFNCTRALVEDMIGAGWGRIVNISSVAALKGATGFAHYAAAKAGILGFTRSLALEISPCGVTVNAIAPGLIDTPILKKSALGDGIVSAMVRTTPVGRVGQPDDIAAAAAYLVSEEASFVTGQTLSPNGGIWM